MLHPIRLLITWEKTNKRVLPILTAPPNPFQEKYSELAREWTRKYAMWIWPQPPSHTRNNICTRQQSVCSISKIENAHHDPVKIKRRHYTNSTSSAHSFFSESSYFLLTQKDRLNWWWGPAHNSRRFPLFSLLKYGGGGGGPPDPLPSPLDYYVLAGWRRLRNDKSDTRRVN